MVAKPDVIVESSDIRRSRWDLVRIHEDISEPVHLCGKEQLRKIGGPLFSNWKKILKFLSIDHQLHILKCTEVIDKPSEKRAAQ